MTRGFPSTVHPTPRGYGIIYVPPFINPVKYQRGSGADTGSGGPAAIQGPPGPVGPQGPPGPIGPKGPPGSIELDSPIDCGTY